MPNDARMRLALTTGLVVVVTLSGVGAKQTPFPPPTDLPNPYRLVDSWPTLPASLKGGRWGEVIRVQLVPDHTIWVFHRCFNTVPAGSATCIGRGSVNPPILQFDTFGEPSSVFVGRDEKIYVGAAFPDATAKTGELRGIVVGNARDGSLEAFIPDPYDIDTLERGSSASGIAVDDMGTIYAADVAAHNLRKYVRVR